MKYTDNKELQEVQGFADNLVNFANAFAVVIAELLEFFVDLPHQMLEILWLLIKDFIEWMIE